MFFAVLSTLVLSSSLAYSSVTGVLDLPLSDRNEAGIQLLDESVSRGFEGLSGPASIKSESESVGRPDATVFQSGGEATGTLTLSRSRATANDDEDVEITRRDAAWDRRLVADSEVAEDSDTIVCNRMLDIIFILDSSGSITAPNFQIMLAFVRDFISMFNLGSDGTLFGVVEFSSTAQVEVPLASTTDKTVLLASVAAIPYIAGSTNTAAGISAAISQSSSRGRNATAGVGTMFVVMTDGASSDTRATIAAANRARAAGVTVACVTLGLSVPNAEALGIVGNNTQLLLRLEDWEAVNSSAAVANLTSVACSTPASINNLVPVNTLVDCNATLFLSYFPSVTSPVTLVANISGGIVVMCFSYLTRSPAPDFAQPGFTSDSSVQCNMLSAGQSSVATTTAYPVNPSGQNVNLYVSVTGIPGADGCGGALTVQAYYCATRIAKNVTVVPGASWDYNSTNFTIPTTWIGNASNPICSACPAGTQWLLDDEEGPICASQCLGAAQFIDVSTGVPRCMDCDPSCATCVAPGTARACTSCRAARPFLLLNEQDPAFVSPFWQRQDSIVQNATGLSDALANPYADFLSGKLPTDAVNRTGRCASTCPASYTTQMPYVCTGAPVTFLDNTLNGLIALPGALLSLCIPPTIAPSAGCSALTNTSLASTYVSFASDLLATVPASLFIRGCYDISNNSTYAWSYTGAVNHAAAVPVPSAPPSSAECNCQLNLSVEYIPAVSQINLPSRLDQAMALVDVTLGYAQQIDRRAVAMQTAMSKVNTTCSTQTITLTAVCVDPDRPNTLPGGIMLYCPEEPAPVPAAGSSSQGNPAVAAALSVLFILLIFFLGWWYCIWRSKRAKLVKHLLSGVSSMEWNGHSVAQPKRMGENPYAGKASAVALNPLRKKVSFTPASINSLPVEMHATHEIELPNAISDVMATIVPNPLAVHSVVVEPLVERPELEMLDNLQPLPAVTVPIPEATITAALRGLDDLTLGESFMEFLVPGSISLSKTPRPKSLSEAADKRRSRIRQMASGQGARRLEIGQGDILRENVTTETVVLRHVETPAIDPAMLPASEKKFTAVVRRDVIAEPSRRRLEARQGGQ